MSSIATRCTAALAGTALLLGVASAASAGPREQETSDWLVGQLPGGLAPASFGDGSDAGLTADVVIALDALGDAADAQAVTSSLSALASDYATFQEPGWVFPGAAGKLAVAAELGGGDASAYGGEDLVALVERSVTVPDEPVGAAFDLYAEDPVGESDRGLVNSIAQSWAVRSLVAAGSDQADDALGYLLRQQCPSGSVRLLPAADHSPCTADTMTSHDTTALVLDVLVRARAAGVTPAAQGVPIPTVDEAITRAADSLEDAQADDGSLIDQDVANTNTTGLAAAGLQAAGREDAAKAAADWVAGLRVPAGSSGPLASSVGAIAYSEEAYDDAKEEGTQPQRDQWLRATAQAALALPLAERVRETDPPGESTGPGSGSSDGGGDRDEAPAAAGDTRTTADDGAAAPAVVAGGATLPAAGSSLPAPALWAALAAVVVGATMLAAQRRRPAAARAGAHR